MKDDKTWLSETSKKVWGLIAGLSVLVSIFSGWESLKQVVSDVQNGTTTIVTAFITWITTTVSLPLWLFFLLMILVFAGITWIMGRLPKRESKIHNIVEKRVKFRDLWIFVEWNKDNGLPVVFNQHLSQALCGECLGRIVSTDVGNYGRGAISYLKCENGHFIGNEVKYADYQKRLDEQRKEAAQKQEELHLKTEEEMVKLKKQKDTGEITEEEMMRIIRTAPTIDPIGYYGAPDILPAYTADEFYARIVYDFERIHLLKKLQEVEIISLEELK